MVELKPLNHTGTVRIETERLILRQASVSDAEQMFNNWANDPEVTKYLTWPPHDNIEVTRTILAGWDEKNKDLTYYHWGIELKKNNQLIGAGGCVNLNENIQSAELGYCIGRAYWGKGYMSEAVAAMIKYLFKTVGFNRVCACHDTENTVSGKVMQKCGMLYEGIQRQAGFRKRNGFYDLAYYAVLKEDFEKK